MTENLLRHEASPYLLQHRDNPVHWRPWGKAALDEAQHTNKPILLSVGYAACHWCHVMAHESFEDAATAAVMNRLFVNIKVDREERPDIDQIYMAALHALGEQGGWPLTMFLAPDGEPIWGGTYFPKTAGYGRPAFVAILNEVARLFRDEPDKIAANRGFIMERLARPAEPGAIVLDRRLLDAAADRLMRLADPVNGGTSGAPKFPQPSLIEFLWRAGARTGESRYRDHVLLTLRRIGQGGIYDHVGGGFARYATDERWLVPHFEKMLYDNAQLVELMTYAWLAEPANRDAFSPSPERGGSDRETRHGEGSNEPASDPHRSASRTTSPLQGEEKPAAPASASHWLATAALFKERVAETVAWLEREMLTPEDAFAASLDADSEGHEGRFYVWTYAEVIEVLGAGQGAFFADTYDVTTPGNWEGVSIPNRLADADRLSDADESRLAAARRRLLDRRATRVRPATDDKILADWNGLMIAALALAGATFGRADWIARAAHAFAFVAGAMAQGDRLAHAWRAGQSVFPGLATDYAAMIKAALALYAATLAAGYLDRAVALAATLRAHHWDTDQPGYFLSADDAERLIIRPRSLTDEATPAATGLMAQNLVRLWHLTGNDDYRRDADAVLAAASSTVATNLFASTGLLNALDLRLAAVDVVVVTPASASPAALLAAVRRRWTANTILSVHDDHVRLADTHPAAGKAAVAGLATAYVCRGETCSLPVTEAAHLEAMLAGLPQTSV